MAEPIEPSASNQPLAEAESKDNESTKGAPIASGLSVLGVAGIATFCAFIVVCVALIGYLKFLDKETKFAVVNIEEIMEAKQIQLASMVAKQGLSDKDRGAAYEMAANFGGDLHEALKKTHQECGCLILTSGAVVSTDTLNLTGRVKELVGLSGVDINAMKKKIEESMRFAPGGK